MSGDQMYSSGHVTSNRVVDKVAFVRPIPILGSHVRQTDFYASDGWLIEVSDFGVTLSKPEQQNVPEVPAFFTCGVGYSVPPAPAPAPVVALEGRAASGAGNTISEASLGNATVSGEALLATKPYIRKGNR